MRHALSRVYWSAQVSAVFLWGRRFSGNHWLKVNESIKYKLLSLRYKVLTTAQPSYLRNLISLQPPRSTRSSSVVTLSRPPTISSLKITDRSFSYASPRLWNQLPESFRQPQHSRLDSHPHSLLNSSMSFYEVKYKTATQFCIVRFWRFLAFFLRDFFALFCAILFPLSDIIIIIIFICSDKNTWCKKSTR